jgi:(2Fe-2S) ferredoxin
VGLFKAGDWALDRNRDLAWGAGDGGTFTFGWNGSIPVAGDWNGDGKTEVGVFADGIWYRDVNGNGYWDSADAAAKIWFGWRGSIPVVGDWNGDGRSDVGVFANGIWYVDVNGNGYWDSADNAAKIWYGWHGAIPVVGDWNSDKKSEVGVYADGIWYRDVNGNGYWDTTDAAAKIWYGWRGATPVPGDWTGDGRTKVGVYADGTWYRDVNGNGYWDAADKAAVTLFGDSRGNGRPAFAPGSPAPLPVVGKWAAAGAPLMAAGPALSASPNRSALTSTALQPIVTEAIARWAATGLSAQALDALTRVNFVVTDLPGSYLGRAEADRIYLDQDAAGHGWFIDPTPQRDEEFAAVRSSTELRALDPRAVDRIDLLTVVEHELGHIAGLSDLDASVNDLMGGALGTGVRRRPGVADVDAIFAAGTAWR